MCFSPDKDLTSFSFPIFQRQFSMEMGNIYVCYYHRLCFCFHVLARCLWLLRFYRRFYSGTGPLLKKIRASEILSSLCSFGSALGRCAQGKGHTGLRDSFVWWSCCRELLWNVCDCASRTGAVYLWGCLMASWTQSENKYHHVSRVALCLNPCHLWECDRHRL